MKKIKVIDHPLAQDKLWHLRNRDTPPHVFRKIVYELSHIMAYELARDFKTKSVKVQTPFAATVNLKITENIAIVPIMRAGQAMLEGMLDMLPSAAVGHIGIYRDKFINNTVEYYFRLPQKIEGMRVAVLDPLLATGDTAIAAISRLKEYGVGEISFVTLLIANEGLKKFSNVHPDVQLFTLSIEPQINDSGYILPGIGDAGDRIYGTFGSNEMTLEMNRGL